MLELRYVILKGSALFGDLFYQWFVDYSVDCVIIECMGLTFFVPFLHTTRLTVITSGLHLLSFEYAEGAGRSSLFSQFCFNQNIWKLHKRFIGM